MAHFAMPGASAYFYTNEIEDYLCSFSGTMRPPVSCKSPGNLQQEFDLNWNYNIYYGLPGIQMQESLFFISIAVRESQLGKPEPPQLKKSL